MLNLFYRNPRLLILTLLLIATSGWLGLTILPRSEDPYLVNRFALITSHYPGATAERVEALVTEKIEEKLLEFDEIKEIESSSRTGIAVLNITLGDKVPSREVNDVWSRVRDELGELRPDLPPAASSPEVETKGLGGAFTLIAALRWDGAETAPAGILTRLGEALEDRLRSLPGSEHTEIYGAAEEEVRVDVDMERLSGLGISVAEFSRLITEHDAKLAAGFVRSEQTDIYLEVAGEPRNLEAVRNIPVRFGPTGQVTRVRDVASVQKAVRTPKADLALIDGKPGTVVAVRMAEGMRVDRWAENARQSLREFAVNLPTYVELDLVFDQSQYVEKRFGELNRNLMFSTLLVILVAFVMMGWRAGLLIGSALPLTMLMVYASMNFFGVPLHQMSVSGLIIALGMLIDNAIIMVDETRYKLRTGLPTAQAIAKSVGGLAVPLFGSTVTTVLAFMPLVLMPGPAGEFVGSIGLTVTMALVSSLFLSLTVLPAFTGRLEAFGKKKKQSASRWWNRGLNIPFLTKGYAQFLRLTTTVPALGILLGIGLPLFGFLASAQLQEQFFPPTDRNQFQIQLTLPRTTALQQTREVALQAREEILQLPGVERVHWFIGTSAPSFYYNMMPGQDASPFFAQALIETQDEKQTRAAIREVQALLDQRFPLAQSLVLQLEQGPPFKAPIELRIYGPDLNKLGELSAQARGILARTSDVVHTRSSLEQSQPKLWLDVHEAEAEVAGLSNRDLARHLQAGSEGILGGTFMEETEELPIRVRWNSKDRDAVDAIGGIDLPVTAPEAQSGSLRTAPLTALGNFELIPEWAEIPRRDGQRLATVQGFIHPGVLPAKVLNEFEIALSAQGFEIPAGYTMDFGGESAERDEAVGHLMGSVGVLMILMAASLVLSFGSFRLAAVIGLVGVLSVGLGLLPLWVFGYPFGFMAIVGTMGLVGVAINDSIVVLAALRGNSAARNGDRKAVQHVVMHATRHVLTTTVTTVAGFLPLILSGGAFWPPLAIAIAGGVLGATVLALVFVPSAFLLLRPRRKPAMATQPQVRLASPVAIPG